MPDETTNGPDTLDTRPVMAEVSAMASDDFAADMVNELRTTRDEVLAAHGQNDLALYERLFRDDQVKACFGQLRDAVVAREVRVDAGGDGELDRAAADFVREQLAAIGFDDATKKMLAGVMYGYAVAECMWGTDGPFVTLERVKVRKAKRFGWDAEGHLCLRRGTKIERMPERKFWTFTASADDDDDPYGLGLGHWLYWPVWLKRNVLRYWGIWCERFSQATPVAHVPQGTAEPERQRILGMLGAVAAGGALVLPKGIELMLLQATSDSGGSYLAFIAKMDAGIAKIILGQTMTTDDGSSLAQGRVHAEVANRGAITNASLICESFMRTVATWLTEWNFPGAAVPLVYRDFSESEDLSASATRDQTLTGIGYRPTVERVREVYGEGYEPVPAQPAAAATGPNFAEAPQAVGDAIDAVLEGEGWRRVMGTQVGALEQLAADAPSLEAMRDRLDEMLAAEPVDLANSLARALFTARVAGNAEAEPDDGPEADD